MREFLATVDVSIREQVSARRKLGRDDALALAERADEIWVAQRAKVVKLDRRKTEADELLGLILGRSGTLRAPSVLLGRRLLVGFNRDMYTEATSQ